MTTGPGGSEGTGGVQARGRYFTLQQAADTYPIFSFRLLRRLVQERRIPFSRAGRCIVIAEADIEAYLERNRVEPPRWEAAS
jgi:excisionase family DNA binding protein